MVASRSGPDDGWSRLSDGQKDAQLGGLFGPSPCATNEGAPAGRAETGAANPADTVEQGKQAPAEATQTERHPIASAQNAMAEEKPYPKKKNPGLTLGRGDVPPKCGTFTPRADYHVPGRDDDVEQLLQDEQAAVAKLVDDAVEQLSSTSTVAAKAAFRRRAMKLSLGARITARTLTRLRLDTKYPPKKRSPST